MSGINDYFRQHFSQRQLLDINFPWGVFKKIDPSLAHSLELITTPEEIIAIVKACDPSKAFGYDGLT